MKVKEVIKLLEKDGWYLYSTKGSHRQYKHPDKPGKATVPGHKMKYAVIIEEGPTSWGAYVPDLPVCFTVSDTREEVETLIKEAIDFHLESMAENHEPIPAPSSTVMEVDAIIPAGATMLHAK